MAKRAELTREALEALLRWLDKDRERAGRRYEHIRQSLVRIFIWRGCHEAEDLADETINRVAQKVPDIAPTYEGDPAIYFYGVARKVFLEYQRRQLKRADPPPPTAVGDTPARQEAAAELERQHDCMERCLLKLSESHRELLRQYYQHDLQAKVDARRELARRLGLSAVNLRVKAHRLRAGLLDCINDCLAGPSETP